LSRLIEVGSERAGALALDARERGLAETLERYAVVFLVMLVAVGFTLRVGGVSRLGFAEDEINKLEAVRAYSRGDYTGNAEHPMLMKAFVFASVASAHAWNSVAPEELHASDETALRLPNVVFGSLTVFPIFLLAAAFFGRRTGLIAAAMWAFGVGAITYNRVAKEDTLLVFFLLFALYFYVVAKRTSGFDQKRKLRNYVLSGASWGLMLASKYFPHYFALNMLYHHFFRVRGERAVGEPRGNTPPLFYAVVVVAFLVANPAVLLPQTLHYLNTYSTEQLLTHHGYLMGETLYHNVLSKAPFGATPVYFYALYLLIKTPLPLLASFVAGLYVLARRWREPGAGFMLLMFLFWIVPYSLAGAKWLRYTLSLMPFVYIIAAVGVVALTRALLRALKISRERRLASFIGAASLSLFIGVPAFAAFMAAPHYALYTNALAPNSAGYYFPHDELYDDGLREAIRFVAEHAPERAVVAHETPGVVRYYLERYNRADLQSRTISDPNFDVTAESTNVFVILQRGRTYFENRDEMEAVRARFTLEQQVVINGVVAAEVYSRAANPNGQEN